MPVERRLREGMQRNADVLDPDIDRLLGSVVARTRRRVRVRRAAIGLAATVATIAVIALGPQALDAVRDLRRDQPARPSPPTVVPDSQALTGTFARRVSGSPSMSANGMAGRWSIDLQADGTMGVVAPDGFTGVLSGSLFQVEGGQFRTAVLGQDVCSFDSPGTYRWIRSGDTLTFEALNDPCRARVELFTFGPWRAVP
jgi:hypothetical protein